MPLGYTLIIKGASPNMKVSDSMFSPVWKPAITPTRFLITSFPATWMILELASTTVVLSMLMLKKLGNWKWAVNNFKYPQYLPRHYELQIIPTDSRH